MEILEKLLGNGARVKIMRLFLQNKTKGFKNDVIAKRCRVSADAVRREVRVLSSVNFIKKRTGASAEWYFDSFFPHTNAFEELLISTDTLNKQVIIDTFKKSGQIKLLLISGVFIKNKDSRVDMLIVGNKIKRGKVEEGMRRLEAEIGAELTYAVFETKEFIYRLSMYDKLVRDILDYPHELLLQAKELSTQALKKS